MCIRDRPYREGDTPPSTLRVTTSPCRGGLRFLLLQGVLPVSYTHLDVYKRQALSRG
ncbi:hypothetical protein [Sphingobium sp. B2]|uniref:hypothetical protein n=1 Tax=Sphingobium sp. B2 TaxID=2583228 RepID=UPI001643A5AE|nr:hypothetical protein [Sphingobium sp. B2]